MIKRTLIASALASALSLTAGLSFAADQQEQVYGSQFMTQQERDEYRAQMRAAKTLQEQEQIRRDHHQKMKERAKAQGVQMPEEPPARRGGTGPGSGMGPGGGSMGPGGGRGN